jgi:lysophospholipase L1-like esterase
LFEYNQTPTNSGFIRSIAEEPPLTGHWQAAKVEWRPERELGAVSFKPIGTYAGYSLHNSTGIIHTDDSTLAISYRPLWGEGNPGQGGLTGPIGASAQSLGIAFIGNSIRLTFNHDGASLQRRIPRGAHVSIIVRFTPSKINVDFDIDGIRASESIATTIAHEAAANFELGYDSANNADIYGYVSQALGVDRAVSDDEEVHLMDWLAKQPIPDAFPASRPLVAILGDSIANGDQVAGYQRWSYRMLADLSTAHPDLQLLNATRSGSGIPLAKNSPYSSDVLPWYSAQRAKNILILAVGTNDVAGGNNLQDMLDKYYGLLDSARATGWKTVACTLLPRSDATLALGKDGFEVERAAFNGDIVAHWAAHADALADVAAIAAIGAASASDNVAYYSTDKIHPTADGHALMEPVYRAAVAGLL